MQERPQLATRIESRHQSTSCTTTPGATYGKKPNRLISYQIKVKTANELTKGQYVNLKSKFTNSPILQKINKILYILLPQPPKVVESKKYIKGLYCAKQPPITNSNHEVLLVLVLTLFRGYGKKMYKISLVFWSIRGLGNLLSRFTDLQELYQSQLQS